MQGLKNAVPKSILSLMNVDGMTRENVASHLQKYRLYLRRLGGLTDKDRADADALQRLHAVSQALVQEGAQAACMMPALGAGRWGGACSMHTSGQHLTWNGPTPP